MFIEWTATTKLYSPSEAMRPYIIRATKIEAAGSPLYNLSPAEASPVNLASIYAPAQPSILAGRAAVVFR